MEGLSPWLQQVQLTPPAPLSPLSQPELGKQHLQGEGRPDDDEALNSSSRARGVHISQNTSVGSSVGRERPRGSCRRTWLIDPRAADGCVPARAGLWARSPTGTQTQVSRSTDNGLLGKSLAKHSFPSREVWELPLLPLRHPHLGGEHSLVASNTVLTQSLLTKGITHPADSDFIQPSSTFHFLRALLAAGLYPHL